MAYTQEQRRRFQVMPANKAVYETVSFENDNADPLHLLVSGANGPYFSMSFTIDGEEVDFIPTSCTIPEVTDQAEDNSLGSVKFGRVGSDAFAFLDAVSAGATTPAGTIIKVTIRRWEQGLDEPIFERVCYVDDSGVTIGADSVSVNLAIDNPALVYAVPFYDPLEYPGMAYSDQGTDEE